MTGAIFSLSLKDVTALCAVFPSLDVSGWARSVPDLVRQPKRQCVTPSCTERLF